MLKVAVCDDNIHYNKKIDAHIKKYMKENIIEVKVDFYLNGRDLIEEFKGGRFDLILLDISMPELNGFETAKQIRQTDSAVTIIFCTFYYDFCNAQKGLAVEAEDFLQKPLSYKKIEMIFKRLNDKKMTNSDEKFVLKKQEGIVVIQISDIIFLETERKTVIVYMKNRIITSYLKLWEFEKKLEKRNFYRCHRSYLINLDYVEGMENNCVILRGIENKQIPVSKNRKAEFLKKLTNMHSIYG